MTKIIIRFCTLLVVLISTISLTACSTPPVKEKQKAEGFNQVVFKRAKDAFLSGDYKTASALFDTLANNGNAEAQYSMGYMHYYGKGLPKSIQQAMQWFKLSANQGNHNAITALATINAVNTVIKNRQTNTGPQETVIPPDNNTQNGDNSGIIDLRASQRPTNIQTASPTNSPREIKALPTTSPSSVILPQKLGQSTETSQTIDSAQTMNTETLSSDPEINEYQASKTVILPKESQSRKWVFQQPSENYTIQIASSNKHQNAVNYTRRVQLDGVYYFRTIKNGQIRYSVVHGSYSNYSLATKKVNVLKKRGYKDTWIRRFKDIKKIMETEP